MAFLVGYVWLALDTSLSPRGRTTIAVLLDVVWVVFGLDYLVRLWLAEREWRLVRRHLLDLAIVLLPMFRQLRVLRLTVIGMLHRGCRTTCAAG